MNLAELKALARRRGAMFAVAAVAILFVLRLSDFWTFVFIGAIGTALIALSVGIVYGRTGMVSLCQFSFAAVSVWVIGWLTVNTALPFVVILLVGGPGRSSVRCSHRVLVASTTRGQPGGRHPRLCLGVTSCPVPEPRARNVSQPTGTEAGRIYR